MISIASAAFSILLSNAQAAEAPVPFIALDPTGAHITVLEKFPSWSYAYLQEGVAYRSSNAKGLDRAKPYCFVGTDARSEIYPGRRIRVREIHGVEQVFQLKQGAPNARWQTTINTGTLPRLEWTFECYGAREQKEELSVAQFNGIINGLLELSGYKVLDYSLSTENTFSTWAPGTALRFNENLDSSMTDAAGRHILFQNGHVAKPWESGPQCHTSGSYSHQLASGAVYVIEELAFQYTHSAGLFINTYSFYEARFKRPGGYEPYMFSCTTAVDSIPESAYRRPTVQEFEKSVGSLVTAVTP